MVRSRAHYYAKCYRMEYEDVEAQGFLIYCMSIKDYNEKKASFSTHLYRNLSGYLLAYCSKNAKARRFEYDRTFVSCSYNGDFDFDFFPAKAHAPTVEQFLAYAKCYLTSAAFEILKWAVTERFLDFRQKVNPFAVDFRKLTTKALSNVLAKVAAMDCKTVESAWQELSDFWNSRGAAFYSFD